jgi:hypothetical protein
MTDDTITSPTPTSMENKIENDIMKLFNTINDMSDLTNVSNEVTQVLYSIFVNNKLTSSELNFHTKHLYKLIFYFCKEKLNASISIICGFIQFGKSSAGTKYKPMIDYFMMETFDALLNQCGWSIIKPFMNMLHNHIHKFQKENIFNYISNKIFNQLVIDIMSMKLSAQTTTISDICYHVPRERSFSFGWYSYYIACHMFGKENYYKQKLKQTHIRHYLMNYRKIINELRKHVIEDDSAMKHDVYSRPESTVSEMNYTTLKVEFNQPQYKAIDEIVDSVLPAAAQASEAEPSEAEPSEAEPSEAEPSEAQASAAPQAEPSEAQAPQASEAQAPQASEAQAPENEQAAAAAPAAPAELEELPLTSQSETTKNEIKKSVNQNTWFSGWFSGWV